MATRYKPKVDKLESLEDVNIALREIGLQERELEQIDAEAQKAIAEIKSAAAKKGEPIRQRIIEVTAKIGAYAEYQKDDLFRERKSIELTFGVFGYRKSTSISVRKTTVDLLRKLKMDKFIRIKEEPDKESMAELDDEALAQVDAVRKIKDEFFVAANREEVNKDLLRASA
jgi:phage host-nuclease inhibitor protein Gam